MKQDEVDPDATAPGRLQLLGRVVGLAVQTNPTKEGRATERRYDPSPIRRVPALSLDPEGVCGVLDDGSLLRDVHHVRHPRSRDRRGDRGISFMATGDYLRLRELYGAHMLDGTAGENLLVESPSLIGRDLSAGLVLECDGGGLELSQVRVATPCVEFTRFCLRRDPGEVDEEIRAGLADLGAGARGFYAVAGGIAQVRTGARLWMRP